MGLFSDDPNFGQNLMNFGAATMAAASQPGARTLGAIGQGMIGANQAAQLQAATQSQQLANQMAQLNLQRSQAMQSGMMRQIQRMFPSGDASQTSPSASGQPSPSGADASGYTDQLGQQALMMAYASGNPENISKAFLSLYEHNPELAGKIKAAQEGETYFKQADDTYAKGNQMGGGKSNIQNRNNPPSSAGANPSFSATAGGSAPSTQTREQRSNMSQADQDAAITDLYGTGSESPISNIKNRNTPMPMAGDGKPIIDGYKALPMPDMSLAPKFNNENTKVGQSQGEQDVKDLAEGDKSYTASLSSLQTEKFRLQELADVYKQTQAGTLIAQHPEIANKLIAWGVIKNPDDIKDVGKVQNAMQNHLLQIMQQIKDTNANLGGTPTRTFAPEITSLIEQGENSGAQPTALYDIIGQATGIVNHHIDLVSGWQSVGGKGNRLANGYTMLPDTFSQKFMLNHDIQDYKKSAQKNMGEFKGMPTSQKLTVGQIVGGHKYIGGNPTSKTSWETVNP